MIAAVQSSDDAAAAAIWARESGPSRRRSQSSSGTGEALSESRSECHGGLPETRPVPEPWRQKERGPHPQRSKPSAMDAGRGAIAFPRRSPGMPATARGHLDSVSITSCRWPTVLRPRSACSGGGDHRPLESQWYRRDPAARLRVAPAGPDREIGASSHGGSRHVGSPEPPKMCFVQDHDLVEAFPTNRTHDALRRRQ